MFNTLLVSLIAAMLTNNLVLSKSLGLHSFFDVSQKGKIKPVIVTTIYLTIILLVTTLVFYPLYYWLLVGANMAYFKTIYAGVILLLVATLTLKVSKRIVPEKYQLKNDQTLYVIANALLLGFLLQSVSGSANYLLALAQSIGSGLGFGLVGILFTTIRYRLEISPIPKGFKGLPIGLITAGLIAMAFLGFTGLV